MNKKTKALMCMALSAAMLCSAASVFAAQTATVTKPPSWTQTFEGLEKAVPEQMTVKVNDAAVDFNALGENAYIGGKDNVYGNGGTAFAVENVAGNVVVQTEKSAAEKAKLKNSTNNALGIGSIVHIGFDLAVSDLDQSYKINVNGDRNGATEQSHTVISIDGDKVSAGAQESQLSIGEWTHFDILISDVANDTKGAGPLIVVYMNGKAIDPNGVRKSFAANAKYSKITGFDSVKFVMPNGANGIYIDNLKLEKRTEGVTSLKTAVDSGYYAENYDSENKSGIVSFKTTVTKVGEANVSKYGTFILKSDSFDNDGIEKTEVANEADIDSGKAFITGVNNIPEESFGIILYAKSFATTGDGTVYGDVVSASVNSEKWLGAANAQ